MKKLKKILLGNKVLLSSSFLITLLVSITSYNFIQDKYEHELILKVDYQKDISKKIMTKILDVRKKRIIDECSDYELECDYGLINNFSSLLKFENYDYFWIKETIYEIFEAERRSKIDPIYKIKINKLDFLGFKAKIITVQNNTFFKSKLGQIKLLLESYSKQYLNGFNFMYVEEIKTKSISKIIYIALPFGVWGFLIVGFILFKLDKK